MNKSDLLILESIISERYISAPKRAKQTQRGYLRDVIDVRKKPKTKPSNHVD